MTTPANVVFDPVAHTYSVDGKIWPSVTQVCSAFQQAVTGRVPFAGIDPFYAQRGVAVHAALAMWLKGELDESTLDPQIAGFFRAGLAAAKKMRLKQNGEYRIEEILLGDGYCGTADLITEYDLVDWKTGKPSWTHNMQLAAYRKTKACAGLRRAGCVYLAEDESYEIRWLPKEEYARAYRWFWAGMDVMEAQRLHTRSK